jgi:hypothetical protein
VIKKKEEMETVDIKGVEILAVGTWEGSTGPVTFGPDDLDTIVASFRALTGDASLNYEPPAKLGHADKQQLLQADGYPAAGWVAGLRRVGGKVVADLKAVPKKVAAVIKAGGYKKVSAEVYRDYEIGGRRYDIVLKAVSFLGADIPAVKTLGDIVAQYEEAGDFETVICELKEKSGAEPEEPEEPPEPEEEPREPEEDEGRGEGALEKQLRELLGLPEGADVLEAVKALKEKAEAPTEKPAETVTLSEHRSVVTQLRSLQIRLAERERDERVARAIESGKITPAQKGWAERYALDAPADFDAFIEAAPVVVALGEIGSASQAGTDVDLTEAEVRLGERMKLTREDLVRAKKQEVNS